MVSNKVGRMDGRKWGKLDEEELESCCAYWGSQVWRSKRVIPLQKNFQAVLLAAKFKVIICFTLFKNYITAFLLLVVFTVHANCLTRRIT